MKAQEIADRLTLICKGQPWFGESLQTKLETVTSETAYLQPLPGKHSIAEIVSHMEYWKKSFIHQLKEDASISFSGDSPDNWPDVKDLKKLGWKNQLNAFEEIHNQLVILLTKSNDKLFDELITNLNGLVDHDIYHMGQIGLLKSLVKELSYQTTVSIV
jgi:uncharacterized damage-inducible protein DinB